jgi:ADP-ribose pyrophosphatase YjhB (NUDIX family)
LTDDVGRIKLVADVALLVGDQVLLVRYKDTRKYDGQAGWFLPDDYLRRREHPEIAAQRILREQVGLDVPGLKLGMIESFENDGAWHLIFHYVGRLGIPAEPVAGPNTAVAEWFPLGKLPDRSTMAHEGWAADVLEAVRETR